MLTEATESTTSGACFVRRKHFLQVIFASFVHDQTFILTPHTDNPADTSFA